MIFGAGPAGFLFIEDLRDPAKRAALMRPAVPDHGDAAPGSPMSSPMNGAAPATGDGG